MDSASVGPGRQGSAPSAHSRTPARGSPAALPLPGGRDGDHLSELSDLYGLFMLPMATPDGWEEGSVLRRAMSSVPRLGPCRAEACYRLGQRGPAIAAGDEPAAEIPLAEQLAGLDRRDGAVSLRDRDRARDRDRVWARAFVLCGSDGPLGFLVVSAPAEPDRSELFLLGALAQQTGRALAEVAGRHRDQERAGALRRANADKADHEAVNAQLAEQLVDLEIQRSVHEVLSRATIDAEGVDGIAKAVHGLTSLPVAIEDCFGNLHAWAGPGRPDPYPKPRPLPRQQLLRDAARESRPLRTKDGIVGLARYRGETLGLITLVDPGRRAGEHELFALDYACTMLALELAHRRNLAEVELRLRRDLVDDLVTGTDDAGAVARAEAVGHDLHGPHHLAVVRWTGLPSDEAFSRAVSGACRALDLAVLPARLSGREVLVIAGPPRGDALYAGLATALGSPTGAVGLSGAAETPHDLPRAYKEALRALELRTRSRRPYGSTSFEQLGLYRLLSTGNDYHEVERFVREWLGPLLDYDTRRHGDLVLTLTQYFACGGNYDGTAAALGVHRSTLRYRLQRIKEISGRDLGDVEHRLNLQVATRVWQIMSG
ncbi:helix-turn-helix domain-containing protein [Streptomyces sp. 150FB]|uniref:PucR family transcriptional regulator n=1 Tax=Streptomyces sp. 150FB TaxID=1576605 RepID=UPI000D146BFE|nr:helix-turn-helix domain-containing protein [Streptomyces sp. 150FB]